MPILWPPDAKKWLIGKDPEAGKDWRQEEKGMTEEEMVGWHHRLNGRESELQEVGNEQGGLACCNSWGRKESDTTEPLNWTDTLIFSFLKYSKSNCTCTWIFYHKRNKERWYLSFSMAFCPIMLALGLPNAPCFLSHRSVATFVQKYSCGNQMKMSLLWRHLLLPFY